MYQKWVKSLFYMYGTDSKAVLLYRFHIVVIIVNLLAIIVDIGSKRSSNIILESVTVLLLAGNAWLLRKSGNLQRSSYLFLLIVATALFIQIGVNHFGTMSVVFVLLLPLTVMLFIRLSTLLMIELVMVSIIAAMLYSESIYNPSNPILQNPTALFHLGYAAVIIFVFGLLYHFSIVHTFEELDASNRQKEMLLQEVHHRVKNNLNVIASMIGLQAVGADRSEKEQLLKSKMRIESIAMVHEMLYRSDDLEAVDFEAYTMQLCNLLLRMSGKGDIVDVHIATEVKTLPLEMMVQLGILINELVTNSIKYAFDTGGGSISMSLQRKGREYLFLYEDSGNGVEEIKELESGNTLGLKLIRLSAKQLRGEVSVSSEKGLKYTIRFKDE